jgi:hypothetical protein
VKFKISGSQQIVAMGLERIRTLLIKLKFAHFGCNNKCAGNRAYSDSNNTYRGSYNLLVE